MIRRIVTVWVSLAMLFGFVMIVDVVTDLTPTVKASTLYVNETGSGGAFTTIQDAINASNDGDTVFVYNGTYFEHIILNKTINLTGENKDTTIIDGSGTGVIVSIEAVWVNITGFNISNGADGINIWSYSYNNISDNIFTLNDGGVRLWGSSNNTIMSNYFSDHMNYPMAFESSSNNTIVNNYLSSTNNRGIYFISTENNIFSNNTFLNNGIFIRGETLSHFNSHTIPSSNTVNGKPILYYKDKNGVNIDGIPVGQLILANCTEFTVKSLLINDTYVGIELGYSSDIRISNNNLVSNVGEGIYLYSSSNNKISNNNISNNGDGISLLQLSNNNSIINNDVSSNDWYGIYIKSSSDNNINNNDAIDNVFGIRLQGSTNNIIINNNASSNSFSGIELWFGSSNNTINSNIGYDNEHGIRLRSSSHNNTIIGNKIYENTGEGISISQSNGNIIMANNVSNNFFGIRVSTLNNEIIGNNVMWNLFSGIEIYSSNNRIYRNNIIGNPTQAIDVTNNNYWDNGYPSGGNYWSDFDESGEGAYDDFQGSDQNILGNDGIVDNGTIGGGGKNPYVIDSDSQDNYPLIEPFDNFIILKQGWNLISIPLIQDNQDLSKVLEMIDGYYDAAQWYNNTDKNDPWKHHKVGKPFGNDLTHLNESMGFWIHITNPGDTIFLYNGTQPISNQSITLHPGWNMVGYPSLINRTRDIALNNIIFDQEVDAIWTFNPATKTWQEIGPMDFLELGRGYWIHSKVTKTWDVPL